MYDCNVINNREISHARDLQNVAQAFYLAEVIVYMGFWLPEIASPPADAASNRLTLPTIRVEPASQMPINKGDSRGIQNCMAKPDKIVGCYKPFIGRAVTWIVRRVARSQRVGGSW